MTADGVLSARIGGDYPSFVFRLHYYDSLKVHFDPTTTFLSKAYNLQHIDLHTVKAVTGEDLEWRLELIFPRPREYGSLQEYDIYGLFTGRERELPQLPTFADIEQASAGLVRLSLNEPSPADHFGIVVTGAAVPARNGWLPCPPEQLFKAFVAFKRELLTARALSAAVDT